MAVKDGDEAELILRPGAYSDTHPDETKRGKSFERTVKGVVRSFKTEPRFDPLTGKQTVFPETRWEISTDDPSYPAIGFDPKTAQFKV